VGSKLTPMQAIHVGRRRLQPACVCLQQLLVAVMPLAGGMLCLHAAWLLLQALLHVWPNLAGSNPELTGSGRRPCYLELGFLACITVLHHGLASADR
jgi:hypothetical protein